MSVNIFYVMQDCGDGSCIVRWFKDEEIVSKYLDKDPWNSLWPNEGFYNTLTLPDNTNLDTIGVSFSDEDVSGELEDTE